MEETERLGLNRELLKALSVVTFGICLLLTALYACARFTGLLPSEAEWARAGGSHGSWWIEVALSLIACSFVAMMALFLITFLLTIAMTLEMKTQRLLTLGKGVALAVFQLFIGICCFFVLCLTVD